MYHLHGKFLSHSSTVIHAHPHPPHSQLMASLVDRWFEVDKGKPFVGPKGALTRNATFESPGGTSTRQVALLATPDEDLLRRQATNRKATNRKRKSRGLTSKFEQLNRQKVTEKALPPHAIILPACQLAPGIQYLPPPNAG